VFVFLIARTPVKMRNSLREELWQISKKSLQTQTSKNWKAIVVGDTSADELSNEFFITLNYDDYPKRKKLQIALEYLKNNSSINHDYLIRFDDDDIFSETILSDIEKLPSTYDCYFDEYHTYVDSVYLKLSQIKNSWIANTAIHKYEHAITVCGKSNLPLLVQDHSEYWHTYYSDKNVYKANRSNPVYYRMLTPFSITSSKSQEAGSVDWKKHLQYLKGYGPWINLFNSLWFYDELKNISNIYFETKPVVNFSYWFFNKLKYLKNRIL
jgi:hypothetical protein